MRPVVVAPTFPWKSTLTGEDCATLATGYEKDTGQQWTQPLLHYVTFEWVVDVFKRVTNIDDKEEIMQAVKTTKMADSMAGPFDFTAPWRRTACTSWRTSSALRSTRPVGQVRDAVAVGHQGVEIRHEGHDQHHGSADPGAGPAGVTDVS